MCLSTVHSNSSQDSPHITSFSQLHILFCNFYLFLIHWVWWALVFFICVWTWENMRKDPHSYKNLTLLSSNHQLPITPQLRVGPQVLELTDLILCGWPQLLWARVYNGHVLSGGQHFPALLLFLWLLQSSVPTRHDGPWMLDRGRDVMDVPFMAKHSQSLTLSLLQNTNASRH